MATEAELLRLKNDVIALLRSHAVQRIRFVAEGVKIGHHVYSVLANLVEADRIKVRVDPTLAAQGVAGRYSTSGEHGNSFALYRGVAVHELTHAAIDYMHLKDSRGLHITENESIAYIAERIYCRHIHHDNVTTSSARPFRVADVIAGKIVAAEPHVYHLTHEDIRSIRNAIGQHPHYRAQHIRGKLTNSDGIP
jgi:hypothetical protein